MKSSKVLKERRKSNASGYTPDHSNTLDLILMLSESNNGRVLQALKVLATFCHQENINELLELDIITSVLKLIQDSKKPNEVIEFSLELLTELLNFKTVEDTVSENEDFILFLYSLVKTKPLDIQVHSLNCISILTCVPSVCQLLYEKCELNNLFLWLSKKDPDVHANILKILYNLVQDMKIAEKVVNLNNFGFVILLNLIKSDYQIVQHRSLNLIQWLTSYDHVTTLKEMFIRENGLSFIMNMIEVHRWADLHEKLFDILLNLCDIEVTFTEIGHNGIKQLLEYVDEIESEKLEMKSYETIIKMAVKSKLGLNLFVQNGLTDLVLKNLRNPKDDMFNISVLGLKTIVSNQEAVNNLAKYPGLVDLMDEILNSENKKYDWSIRKNASSVVETMARKSREFYNAILNTDVWNNLINLLIVYRASVPYELRLNLVKLLNTIIFDVYLKIDFSSNQSNKLIGLLKSLVMHPNSTEVELKCIATEIMGKLVKFPQFRDHLKYKKVYKSLTKLIYRAYENYTVLESYLKLFITIIEWDTKSDFLNELVSSHGIEWFINRSDILLDIPLARRFLDTVFDKNKAVKLHFANRLDLWDKIKSGFYAERAASIDSNSRLKSLSDYMKEDTNGLSPVYYIDFVCQAHDIPAAYSDVSTFTDINFLSEININGSNECSGCVTESLHDPFLMDMLNDLKLLLGYCQNKHIPLNLIEVLSDRDKYISNVKLLSNYVSKIMNRINEVNDLCRNHSFELHISDIQSDLGCFIIPIGHLKLGEKFERALLFKTLGDQVCIPSAFVRGQFGNSWIEIYLPPCTLEELNQAKQKDEHSTSIVVGKSDNSTSILKKSRGGNPSPMKKKVVPKIDTESVEELELPPNWYLQAYHKYMITNHVVDLDENVGEFYPIGSVEAQDYTSLVGYCHPYFSPRTNIPPLIRS